MYNCDECGWQGEELKVILVDGVARHDLVELEVCPECEGENVYRVPEPDLE